MELYFAILFTIIAVGIVYICIIDGVREIARMEEGERTMSYILDTRKQRHKELREFVDAYLAYTESVYEGERKKLNFFNHYSVEIIQHSSSNHMEMAIKKKGALLEFTDISKWSDDELLHELIRVSNLPDTSC